MHVNYVFSDDEAKQRATESANRDPFPDIPPALLSSEHIQAYVRQTAMLYPFTPDKKALKAASYEIKPGGLFVRWDEDGKHVVDVKDCDEIILPANSNPLFNWNLFYGFQTTSRCASTCGSSTCTGVFS